jgi:hypothetical protein
MQNMFTKLAPIGLGSAIALTQVDQVKAEKYLPNIESERAAKTVLSTKQNNSTNSKQMIDLHASSAIQEKQKGKHQGITIGELLENVVQPLRKGESGGFRSINLTREIYEQVRDFIGKPKFSDLQPDIEVGNISYHRKFDGKKYNFRVYEITSGNKHNILIVETSNLFPHCDRTRNPTVNISLTYGANGQPNKAEFTNCFGSQKIQITNSDPIWQKLSKVLPNKNNKALDKLPKNKEVNITSKLIDPIGNTKSNSGSAKLVNNMRTKSDKQPAKSRYCDYGDFTSDHGIAKKLLEQVLNPQNYKFHRQVQSGDKLYITSTPLKLGKLEYNVKLLRKVAGNVYETYTINSTSGNVDKECNVNHAYVSSKKSNIVNPAGTNKTNVRTISIVDFNGEALDASMLDRYANGDEVPFHKAINRMRFYEVKD